MLRASELIIDVWVLKLGSTNQTNVQFVKFSQGVASCLVSFPHRATEYTLGTVALQQLQWGIVPRPQQFLVMRLVLHDARTKSMSLQYRKIRNIMRTVIALGRLAHLPILQNDSW